MTNSSGVEEESKEATTPAVEEEVKVAPVEEEEEVGYTLDDFLAEKAEKSTGLLNKKGSGREREKVQDRVEGGNDKQRVTTIQTGLGGADTYKVIGGENSNLLGFQAGVDDGDVFEARAGRGGRGGRGGRDDRGPREPRQGGQRRGRGGKLDFANNDDFPAL